MRLNLPVTNQEYPFPAGHTLVSVTDPKGRIIYCNQRFVEVSGFELDELLGQAHNIIRHPAIPEEVFRDLWETIRSGRPWSGVLKNRRKDGSHYWVVANVTPLIDESGITGYMSVRTEATREQTSAAEECFRRMREEVENGRLLTVFRNGRIIRRTPFGYFCEAFRFDLSVHMHWVALVGFAGAFMLWLLLRRWVVTPIDSLIHCANRIAACDLGHTIERSRNDKFGELQAALGQLSVNLKSIVRDAREQSTLMSSRMTGMTRDNRELAGRTSQQASNLQQSAVALEQITGAVRSTAESARQAAAASVQAVSVTENGQAAVDDLGSTMASISEASSRIHEIIKVIDGIAFQTNILVLNAAVEAARAGEHGKGFAVVAAEVRALAQRSSTAAGEIAELISDTSARIHEGARKTGTAQSLMKEAASSIQEVNSLIAAIDRAASEQLESISQISVAIGSLDGTTSENVAFAARMAEATQALEHLADATAQTVRVFRIDATQRELGKAVALRRQIKQGAAGVAIVSA